ncbi:hypothetical protein A2U01_0081413, partial [Trifolium medium]|nr:hypothetical protein [Trifolium medium]
LALGGAIVSVDIATPPSNPVGCCSKWVVSHGAEI